MFSIVCLFLAILAFCLAGLSFENGNRPAMWGWGIVFAIFAFLYITGINS